MEWRIKISVCVLTCVCMCVGANVCVGICIMTTEPLSATATS